MTPELKRDQLYQCFTVVGLFYNVIKLQPSMSIIDRLKQE
jgi:hypothetical protein